MIGKLLKLSGLLAAGFLFIVVSLHSQTVDPRQLIARVTAAFDLVKDYEVDASVKIDVDFMDVPDGTAKVYFKQPDKISVQSKTFALMPREGVNFTPKSLFKGKYTAVYVQDDMIDGFATHQVKIVPLDNKTDLILATIWVDKSKPIIRKVESSTKKQGTYTILLTYSNAPVYPLPSRMTILFDIKRGNMMKNMPGKKKSNNKVLPMTVQGKVYISYSNYKVNKGVSDSVFKEKK